MTKHQAINIPLNVSVGGRFKIEAVRPDGTRRVVADWFDNLILNQGLDHLAVTSNRAWFNGEISMTTWALYAHVGSGNSTPLATDTGLQTPVATSGTRQGTNTWGNSGGVPDWYFWWRTTTRFAVGAAAGNLSEVGVGWGAAGADLFSRALIKDQFGNPITITILSDEILDVTYEFRLYPPATDSTFNVTISGTTYSCTSRAWLYKGAGSPGNSKTYAWEAGVLLNKGVAKSLVTQDYGNSITCGFHESDALVPLSTTANIPGAVAEYFGGTVGAYTAGSYTLTFTNSADLNAANFTTGIGMFCPAIGLGMWQISFTPKIPKDATKVLTLNWQVSWSRRP